MLNITLDEINSFSSDDILRLLIYEYFTTESYVFYSVSEYSEIFYKTYNNIFNYFSSCSLNDFKNYCLKNVKNIFNDEFDFFYFSNISFFIDDFLDDDDY